jgi:hypothetical protein
MPEPICQDCKMRCAVWEDHGEEIWCYCGACDIETFHPVTPVGGHIGDAPNAGA